MAKGDNDRIAKREGRMDNAQYRIDLLQNRIAQLEQWQQKAREDIQRMEQAIVELAKPRSTQLQDSSDAVPR
jgi:chaperonin cofactor prefoldin